MKASIVIHKEYVALVPAEAARDVRVFQNVFELLDFSAHEGVRITLVEYAISLAAQRKAACEAEQIRDAIKDYAIPVGSSGSTLDNTRRVDFRDPSEDANRKISPSAMYCTNEARIVDARLDSWAKDVSKEDVQMIQARLLLQAENQELRRKIAALEAKLK